MQVKQEGGFPVFLKAAGHNVSQFKIWRWKIQKVCVDNNRCVYTKARVQWTGRDKDWEWLQFSCIITLMMWLFLHSIWKHFNQQMSLYFTQLCVTTMNWLAVKTCFLFTTDLTGCHQSHCINLKSTSLLSWNLKTTFTSWSFWSFWGFKLKCECFSLSMLVA